MKIYKPSNYPFSRKAESERIDLIYVFRENTGEAFLDHYSKTRIQVAKNYKQGIYEGDLEKVQKYISYARTFNPKIGDDVELLLRHFLKQMAKSGVDGLFRKFDSLLRVSIGIARLKLKSVVDVEDTNEAMQIFQFMLSEFNLRKYIIINNGYTYASFIFSSSLEIIGERFILQRSCHLDVRFIK